MATQSTYRLILALIILLAVTLVLVTFGQVRFFPGADEGCYLRYAAYIAEKGLSGFSAIFQGFVQDEAHWFNPNPLRVGFIMLSAAWLKIAGYSFINLAFLSLFSYALFLGFSYYFARKYLGEQLALLLVILLAFSPLQMAMARRALMESTLNLFSILSIWLFWDYLKNRGRLKFILFVAVYIGSILIKETSVLLVIVFLLYFLAERFIYGKKTGLKAITALLFLPLIFTGLAYLALGCFPYMSDTLKILFGHPQPASYATLFCSGPWYRYLIDYMLLSPWVVILAIGFIFSFFLQREEDALALYFIFVFLLTFILFSVFMKNVRYVIILDTPLRLFSLLMLNSLARRVCPRQGHMKLTFVLVMVLVLFDCFNFYNLFIAKGIYDPTSFFLLKAKQIIPFN
ncbi:MAG: glycosyltransferase family 39 protein [Candidatus Omnitrophica bacterium]|nr:glycosyltransferase family 39 protein [Candidatus Omnitrophota bacterium]